MFQYILVYSGGILVRVEWGGVRVLEFRERLEGVATRPREGGPVGHPGVPPGDHQGIARTLLGLFADFLPIVYLILSLLLARVSMSMFVVVSMFTFRSSTGLNVAVGKIILTRPYYPK